MPYKTGFRALSTDGTNETDDKWTEWAARHAAISSGGFKDKSSIRLDQLIEAVYSKVGAFNSACPDIGFLDTIFWALKNGDCTFSLRAAPPRGAW